MSDVDLALDQSLTTVDAGELALPWPVEGTGSTCFHPVHDVELVLDRGAGSTCFHPVHDVDLVLDGAGGTCFHPEHEMDLFLHQSLSAIDAIELERCR